MAMFRSVLQTNLSDRSVRHSDGPSGVAFAGAALIMALVALFLFAA
jgi:hypothetical protein